MVIVSAFLITGGLVFALFAGAVGMITLLLRLLHYIDLAVEPAEADPGTGGRGGGGAGLPREPSSDGGEPAWWPEFERRLADYAARAAGR